MLTCAQNLLTSSPAHIRTNTRTRTHARTHKYICRYGRTDASKTLGYDWIAGMLDTTSAIEDLPDDLFDDIREFRRVNHEECVCPLPASHEEWAYEYGAGANGSGGKDDLLHIEPQPGYRVNGHLHLEQQPESGSPVVPNNLAGYVRVSIRERFIAPLANPKFGIKGKGEYDPTASLSLKQHCLRGWENAKPSSMPPRRSIDLRTASKMEQPGRWPLPERPPAGVLHSGSIRRP